MRTLKTFLQVLFFLCASQIEAQVISGNANICQGNTETYEIDISPGPDIAINWVAIGGTVNAQDEIVEVTYDESGNFTLQAIVTELVANTSQTFEFDLEVFDHTPVELDIPNTSCQYSTSIPDVNNIELPVIPICENSSFDFSIVNYDEDSNYDWIIEGNGSIIQLGNGNFQISVGEYEDCAENQITLIETTFNGCTSEASFFVLVLPPLDASFFTNPNIDPLEICLGESISFYNNSFFSSPLCPRLKPYIESFEWYVSDGTYTYSEDLIHTFNSSGNYEVTLTVNSNCGCSDSFTKTVVVSENSGPEIICPSLVCDDEPVTYYTDADCGSYLWIVDPSEGTILSDSNTESSVIVQWLNPTSGFATITLHTSDCGFDCEFPVSSSIPIIREIEILGDDTICSESEQKFYSVSNISGASYEWSVVSGDADLINSTSSSFVRLVSNSEVAQIIELEVTVTMPFNLCTKTESILITALPELSLELEDRYCSSSELNIPINNYSSALGDISFQMLSGPLLSIVYEGEVQNGIVQIPIEVMEEFDKNWFRIELFNSDQNNLSFCNQGDRFDVLLANVNSNSFNINGPLNVCLNEEYTYDISGLFSSSPWEFDSWIISGGNIANPNAEPTSVTWFANNGVLEYVIKSTQVEGCYSTDFIEVSSETPELNILTEEFVCANSQTSFTFESSFDFSNSDITWSLSDPTLGSITGLLIQWNNVNEPTEVLLIGEAEYCNGQVLIEQQSILISPPDSPEILGPDELCDNESLELTSSLNGDNYFWYLNGELLDQNSKEVFIHHDNFDEGSIQITLTIDMPNGCSGFSTSTKNISVNPVPLAVISSLSDRCFNCSMTEVTIELYAVEQAMPGSFNYSWFHVTNTEVIDLGVNDSEVILIGDPNELIGSYYCEVTNVDTGCYETSETIKFNCEDTGSQIIGPAEIVWDHNGIPGAVSLQGVVGNQTPVVFPSSQGDVSIAPCAGLSVPISDLKLNECNYFWSTNGVLFSNELEADYTYEYPGFFPVTFTSVCPLGDGSFAVNTHTENIVIPYFPEVYFEIECGNSGYNIDLINNTNSLPVYSDGIEYSWLVNGETYQGESISLPQNLMISELDVQLSVFDLAAQTLGDIPNNLADVTYTFNLNEEFDGFPIASFSTNPSPVCSGYTVDLIPDYSDQMLNPVWSFSDGSQLLLPEGVKQFFNNTSSSVTEDVSFGFMNLLGCEASSSSEVVILPNLELGHIDYTLSDCQLTAPTLTYVPNSSSSEETFVWNTGETTAAIQPLSSGDYSVTVYSVNGCSASSNSVSVNLPIELDAEILSSSDILCENSPETILYSLNSSGGFTYQWNLYDTSAPSVSISSSTTSSFSFNNSDLSAGSYQVTLTITLFNNPSCTKEFEADFEVYPEQIAPDITISYECEESSPYQAILTASDDNFIWLDSQDNESPRQVGVGTYQVETTGEYCNNTSSVTVNRDPNLANFPSGCYHFCEGELNEGVTFYIGVSDFSEWVLEHIDSGVIVASSTLQYDGIVTIDGSWEEGDYQLIGMKFGCEYISEVLQINFLPELDADMTQLECGYSDGIFGYEFVVEVYDVDEDLSSLITLSPSVGTISMFNLFYENGVLTVKGFLENEVPLSGELCMTVSADYPDVCETVVCSIFPDCACVLGDVAHQNQPNFFFPGEELCYDLEFFYGGTSSATYELEITSSNVSGVSLSSSLPTIVNPGMNSITLCFDIPFGATAVQYINFGYDIIINDDQDCVIQDQLNTPCYHCDFDVVAECNGTTVTLSAFDELGILLDPTEYEILWVVGDQAYGNSQNPVTVSNPAPMNYSVTIVGEHCDYSDSGNFQCIDVCVISVGVQCDGESTVLTAYNSIGFELSPIDHSIIWLINGNAVYQDQNPIELIGVNSGEYSLLVDNCPMITGSFECDDTNFCDLEDLGISSLPNCIENGEEFCITQQFYYSGPAGTDISVLLGNGTSSGLEIISVSPNQTVVGVNTVTFCMSSTQACNTFANVNFAVQVGDEACHFDGMAWEIPCCDAQTPDCGSNISCNTSVTLPVDYGAQLFDENLLLQWDPAGFDTFEVWILTECEGCCDNNSEIFFTTTANPFLFIDLNDYFCGKTIIVGYSNSNASCEILMVEYIASLYGETGGKGKGKGQRLDVSFEAKLYPNPTSEGFVYLEFPQHAADLVFRYFIFNDLGQKTQDGELTAGTINQLELKGLKPGVYSIVINGKDSGFKDSLNFVVE